MKKQLIFKIAIMAMMMALATTLKIYGYTIDPNNAIRFFAIPLLLSGIILGAKYGAITGLGADLIYGLFFSGYPFNPVYTVTSILWGLAGGFIGFLIRYHYLKKDYKFSLVGWLGIILVVSLIETNLIAILNWFILGKTVAIADLSFKYLIILIKLPILTLTTKVVIDRLNSSDVIKLDSKK